MIELLQLIRELPKKLSQGQISLIVASTSGWLEATSLPAAIPGSGDFVEEERPELRALLSRLVVALEYWHAERKKSIPNGLRHLRQVLVSDPLPEVRRSLQDF